MAENEIIEPLVLKGKRVSRTWLSLAQEQQLEALVKQLGGRYVTTSVSEKTSYFVIPDSGYAPTSKFDKAKELVKAGVPLQIIKYSDFVRRAEESLKHPQNETAEDLLQELLRKPASGGVIRNRTDREKAPASANDPDEPFTSRFAEKIIVTTCLSDLQESYVAKYVDQCGGWVKSAVSGKTDYLVVSDTDFRQTNKYSRAQELIHQGKNITVIGYADFMAQAREDAAFLKKTKKKRASAQRNNIPAEESRPEDFTIEKGILKSYTGKGGAVTVPNGVKYIGTEAFALKNITEIIIPEGVKEIRKDAFRNCRQLLSAKLPESLEKIGEYAFAGCKTLEEIDLPEGVTEIGRGAFMDTHRLKTVHIPSGVTVIKKATFRGSGSAVGGIGEVIFPAGLKEIQEEAFYCNIGTLVLNGNDLEINRYAFYGKIQRLIVEEGVKKIAGYSFDGCGRIPSVIFRSAQTRIGSSAFDDSVLPQLAETVLPAQLNTEQRRRVFHTVVRVLMKDAEPSEEYRTQWLKAIKNQRLMLEDEIGEDKNLRDLMLQEGFVSAKAARALLEKTRDNELKMQLLEYVRKLGKEGADAADELTLDADAGPTLAEVRKSFKLSRLNTETGTAWIGGYKGKEAEVTIPATAGKYRIIGIDDKAFRGWSVKSVMISEGVTSNGSSAFEGCSALTSVTIPESVTSIGSEAFKGCRGLTSVTIPESVTSIGSSAFEGCGSLTSVTIPEGVTSIGSDAFRGCSSLTSVTIPDSVTSIGDSAFSGCSRLKSVTIPEGVTSIGWRAFEGCRELTSVTILDGVTSIEMGAFYGCSRLTSVTVPANLKMKISNLFDDCPNITIHAPAGSDAERFAKVHNIPFVAE